MNLWASRFKKTLNETAEEFNSSLPIDSRMYKEDIAGSIAHAAMLGSAGIIPESASVKIIEGLEGILADIENGVVSIDAGEDIHMFVEALLTERIGDVGKMLHTARSRNDQVALDTRLFTLKQTEEIIVLLKNLIAQLTEKAAETSDAVMPGYTHMQRAQPITFAHQLLAYAAMFLRDAERFSDSIKRTAVSPLGCGALAGTTYPINRHATAAALGMAEPSFNSLDGVSDRDFCVECSACIALAMTHLSRFSEEIILWCSSEFGFVELDDAYSTGSSMMPQKKNPDMAELVRGKTGRTYGNLIALLTMLKGLPLAYNKDMQEDKEALFDSFDTLKNCISIFIPMLKTLKINREKMRKAALEGFINATDCADYLVKKGMPFRSAYAVTGKLVAYCIDNGFTFETLPLEIYKQADKSFGEDIYNAVSVEECLKKRGSFGGSSPENIPVQIEIIRAKTAALKEKL